MDTDQSNTKREMTPWKELTSFADEGDVSAVNETYQQLGPTDMARAFSRLSLENQRRVLLLLESDAASGLVEEMPDAQAADIVVNLEPGHAAEIIEGMPSSEAADLLGELDSSSAEQIIEAMEPEAAEDAKFLSQYEDDTAGGLMSTEFLSYSETLTARQVISDMRDNAERYGGYKVQYAYVVSDAGVLVGVLVLRELLLAKGYISLSELMRSGPISIHDTASLPEIEEFFHSNNFLAVPVTSENGRLLGVVTREALKEAVGDRADDVYLKTQGIVGGEEFRSMPVFRRSSRRLSWLSVNIVLNVMAASVIAYYQDTLASVIALAVFLPIISDMSGCSGNQAVAVTMRELTLGLIRPGDFLHVWVQEIKVGIINGIALGVLIATIGWFWKGNPYLGLVAGAALAVNTVIAVSIGGLVPLILKRLKLDPALASGPILTTVTDMCGFFLVLSIASAMLPLII